jgi:hypothetical protein
VKPDQRQNSATEKLAQIIVTLSYIPWCHSLHLPLTLPGELTEMADASGHMPADVPPLLLGKALIVWQLMLTLPAAHYPNVRTKTPSIHSHIS